MSCNNIGTIRGVADTQDISVVYDRSTSQRAQLCAGDRRTGSGDSNTTVVNFIPRYSVLLQRNRRINLLSVNIPGDRDFRTAIACNCIASSRLIGDGQHVAIEHRASVRNRATSRICCGRCSPVGGDGVFGAIIPRNRKLLRLPMRVKLYRPLLVFCEVIQGENMTLRNLGSIGGIGKPADEVVAHSLRFGKRSDTNFEVALLIGNFFVRSVGIKF